MSEDITTIRLHRSTKEKFDSLRGHGVSSDRFVNELLNIAYIDGTEVLNPALERERARRQRR